MKREDAKVVARPTQTCPWGNVLKVNLDTTPFIGLSYFRREQRKITHEVVVSALW